MNSIALCLGSWLLIALLAGEKWKWPFLVAVLLVAPTTIVTVPEQIMQVILLGFQAVFIPQIIRSWRAWRQHTPIPAVSNLTWALVLISSFLWLSYAILDDRTLVIITGLIAIFASILILVLTRLANKNIAGEAIRGEGETGEEPRIDMGKR